TPTREQVEQWKGEGLTPEQREQKAEEHRQANLKKRKEITAVVTAPLNAIDDSEAYKREQKRIADRRAKIEAKHRKRIEEDQRERAAEIELAALRSLRRALASHGVKKRGNRWLKALYVFIRKDVCQGDRTTPVIRDVDLRRIVDEVEELTGTEKVTERLFLAYSPGMKDHLDEWAADTPTAEELAEARRRVLERVRFVAVFPDGISHLVQSVVRCVHDEKDAKAFDRAAPDKAALVEIERAVQIEAEKRATIRFQHMAERGTMAAAVARKGDTEDVLHDPSGEAIFRTLIRGFAKVEFHGKSYSVPPKGRQIVRLFLKAWTDRGETTLIQSDVLTELGSSGETLRDSFKGHMETWHGLFRHVEKARDVFEFLPAVAAQGGGISV
ncbi:hypothetical protein ACFLSJ_09360, partial [Verrucomicrobiota bacterium]